MTLVHSMPKFCSCDECNNRLVLNSSNLVCSECGLIHDPIISQIQDFNSFSGPSFPYCRTKTSGPYRYRSDHLEVKYCGLTNLYKTLFHIFSYLELTPNVKRRTLYLIRKNHKKNKSTYSHLALASLIQAIKEHKLLIPDTTIIATFREFRMKIGIRPTNTVRRELGFKARLEVTDYLKQYLSMLHEQKPELEYRAIECLELAKLKRKYQGNSPRVFAAAIIFVVYRDQKIRQVYLSKLFEVAPFSLRATKEIIYQELEQC